MPPDLKMESRPSRWWERLCRMLVVQRAVSRSLVLCMVRTTAATIWDDCIRARRDASFLESWFTIMAALLTTTWGWERSWWVKGVPGQPPEGTPGFLLRCGCPHRGLMLGASLAHLAAQGLTHGTGKRGQAAGFGTLRGGKKPEQGQDYEGCARAAGTSCRGGLHPAAGRR